MFSFRALASLTLGLTLMFESWGYVMPHQDPSDVLILVNKTNKAPIVPVTLVKPDVTPTKPELSEKAGKYYEQLKKKFGNYEFILVSSEEKENAKANAAKYANGFKTVVLIDEEKIERMASDSGYRAQYEGILSGAASRIQQLKTGLEKTGANIKGFGIQVNDNGTNSLFAVLKKSSAEQKARIEKKMQQNRADRKAAEKKEAKKKAEERLKEKQTAEADEEGNTITFSADSVEELLQKITDYSFDNRSNEVQTEYEKQLGQNIDFRG